MKQTQQLQDAWITLQPLLMYATLIHDDDNSTVQVECWKCSTGDYIFCSELIDTEFVQRVLTHLRRFHKNEYESLARDVAPPVTDEEVAEVFDLR